MRPSQFLAISSVVVLIAGVVLADHYCRVRPPTYAITQVWDELLPASHPAAPLSLTASDGSGLALAAMKGRAVVSDPLAFTELHLTFDNPQDRVIEGTFSITLPIGATVSRFAMKIGDAWQEGEMVEKQAARVAYEDFLHRRQDPALLEQGTGNAFSARVFPIPARGTKELIVAYTQELSRPYVLPLRGLPEIGSIDLAITLEGATVPIQSLRQSKLVPKEDFTLDPAHVRPTPGLRSENLVLARVQPMRGSAPDVIPSAIVLFDTSASRALEIGDQIELLGRIAQSIRDVSGPDTPLSVACFDQTTEPVFAGNASGFGDAELAKVRERDAFGASNLEQALAWANEHAKAHGQKRVIVVTDGVPTAGETEADKIAAVATRLKDAGVERIDVIGVGGIRDDGLLKRLATAGLARDGAVIDGRLATSSLSRRLNAATRSGIPVKVENANWWFPRTLDGVQTGDEVFVYADLPEREQVRVSIDGAPVTMDLQHVERPLLERAWVQAKIGSLRARERVSGATAETKEDIVDLSVRYRVMSPYTSLLVLETDRDYARFKIDRNSLADILTIDDGRLALVERKELPSKTNTDQTAAATATAEPHIARMANLREAQSFGMIGAIGEPRETTWGDTRQSVAQGGGGAGEGIGLGNIGTIGHGAGTGTGQGFGNGHGRLGGAHDVQAPSLRQGDVVVNGALPGEVVVRIVRQNFGRFRLCYEEGLRRDPSLTGSVSTRFTIDRTGAVTHVEAAGASLPDASVAACVNHAFANLSFPQPETRTVIVTYPIVFRPDGGGAGNGTVTVINGPTGASSLTTGAITAPVLEKPRATYPYEGKLKTVMESIAGHDAPAAVAAALAWHKESPGDILALVALGEAYEATNDGARAMRAYGSIIDLFSSRADLRRFAGVRLERIGSSQKGSEGALDLALDTYAKAAVERPDHPASHRLLAYAWLKKHDYAKAFDAAAFGAQQSYPSGRFAGVDRILRDDLGLIAAAWIKVEPARRAEILEKLSGAGGTIEDAPSIRFVLNWETDANDVDFHIYDDRGGHAYYASKTLPSGGELYADVTTGYGPECFTIRLPKKQRSPTYTLQANYYSRGPMGYGMGKLEIIDHDGHGGLTFEERPFVVMVDHAFVDLGTVHSKS